MLVTLQLCERLCAAGVRPRDRCFERALAVLGGVEDVAQDDARDAARDAAPPVAPPLAAEGARASQEHAARSIAAMRFEDPRVLIWLWRRATRLRKVAPPAAATSAAALAAAADAFEQPELPLVLDLGCGFGTTLLSLGDPCRAEQRRSLAPLLPERFNMLGCDGVASKVAFARGVAARWGTSGNCSFAVASANETLEWARGSQIAGLLLQFPTPFRIAGGANTQLPDADDGFMASRALLQTAAALLRNGGAIQAANAATKATPVAAAPWLLLQSNVEDVALAMRGIAEEAGLVAVTAEELVLRTRVGQSVARGANELGGLGEAQEPRPIATGREGFVSGERGERRRARAEELNGSPAPRASGPGWLDANPLGVRTETEAALEVSGRRIFRVLLCAPSVEPRMQVP